MEGGGGATGWKLGDIGDYRDTDDFWPIGTATVFVINMSVALARFGGIGGVTLNTYFDTFGLEGILANSAWVVILFQIARWVYTTFYATSGGTKPWSPFIFVCMLLAIQILHDLIFYYGMLKNVPSGRNEMMDALKRYGDENGRKALGGHSFYLILTAVVAMFLKESSHIFSLILLTASLYILPFVIATLVPKQVATSGQAQQQAGKEPRPDKRDGFYSGSMTGTSARMDGGQRIQSWNSLRGDF